MKQKLTIIMFALIIFSGCSAKSKVAGQTGILVETTGLYYTDPQNNEGRLVMVEENALVLILDENEDYYHVQLALTELPTLSGFVEKKCVSFGETDIKNASSGLAKDVNVYESPEQNAAIKLESYSSAVLIEADEGEFYKCALPGGDFGWIEKKDMQFIVEKSE